MTSRAVLDVAGVAVAVEAPDEARVALALDGLAGFPAVDRVPVATVRVTAASAPLPAGPPRDELLGIRLWLTGEGAPVVVASERSVVVADRDEVVVHVPDLADAGRVEAMLTVGLTWVLGAWDRFVVHGGAVARGDDGLVVLGHSGAGKSTLVAAALEHGWRALADDLVVLGRVDGALRVWGVHRRPAIPTEIGGPVVARGVPEPGPRARAELSASVLDATGAEPAGLVIVGHSPQPGGSLRPTTFGAALPLLLQSFAGTVDAGLRARYFAFTRHLHDLGVWELGHAARADLRRRHAADALATCLDERGAAGLSDAR